MKKIDSIYHELEGLIPGYHFKKTPKKLVPQIIRGMHNAVSPNSVQNLNPFCKSLLIMDDRIKIHSHIDDVESGKYLFVTKNNWHIPYMMPAIEHQISHIVEMKNSSRWLLPELGMKTFNGTNHTNSSFFAAIAREVRVRAIQIHINNDFLLIPSIKNIIENDEWRRWSQKILPYGRFKTIQDVKVWVDTMRETTYKEWNQDRIEHEWKIRLDYIRNYWETK